MTDRWSFSLITPPLTHHSFASFTTQPPPLLLIQLNNHAASGGNHDGSSSEGVGRLMQRRHKTSQGSGGIFLAKLFRDVSKFLVYSFYETLQIKLNTNLRFFNTLLCLLTLLREWGKDICLGFDGWMWWMWVEKQWMYNTLRTYHCYIYNDVIIAAQASK